MECCNESHSEVTDAAEQQRIRHRPSTEPEQVGKTFPIEIVARFDENNLIPRAKGKRFNASIIDDGDGTFILAVRDGWAGSNIWLVRLDSTCTPIAGTEKKLPLIHRAAGWGREDPRLFRLNGHLHVAFVGVIGRNGPTNVLFARINNQSWAVEDIFHPVISGRNSWEKNHSYFDYSGVAHAVYSIAPHRVLQIEGNQSTWAYETPTPAAWFGGELRGGATPVRVGDEFWSFIHGRANYQGRTSYNIGLYTFSAEPPFEARRIIPHPIQWASHADKPGDQYVSVIFPCGAVHCGDHWLVSMGVHDRWTEIRQYSHETLEGALVPIRPPIGFELVSQGDRDIFAAIHGHDEYRIGGSSLKGCKVLDIGAHIGIFSLKAKLGGAAVVHSYEPDAGRYQSLAQHAERFGFTAHNQAITTPADLARAIDALGGAVDLLKIDCEGCEFDVLPGANLLKVKAIVAELHDRPESKRVRDLLSHLKAQGFYRQIRPNGNTPMLSATRGKMRK